MSVDSAAVGPVWMPNPSLPYIVPSPGPTDPKLSPHRYLYHKTPSHCLDMIIRDEIPMPPGQPRWFVVTRHPFSFDGEPDTSDNPLLYTSRYIRDTHRRCFSRHFHETLTSLVQTMFHIDLRHRRFRNMRRRLFFRFSTFDRLIDMFMYDDLGPAGCVHTRSDGVFPLWIQSQHCQVSHSGSGSYSTDTRSSFEEVESRLGPLDQMAILWSRLSCHVSPDVSWRQPDVR
jgi:hypothetical protein